MGNGWLWGRDILGAAHAAAHGEGRGCRLWGGALLGLGGFNLFDGIVQHKLLRLHQVRPAAEDWLPYDVGFVGVALDLTARGALLPRGTDAGASRRRAP